MILPASAEHLDQILMIERATFDQPWSRVHFEVELFNEPTSSNWVDMENGLVTAYLFGWLIEDEFHINNIAVHSDYRRRGIGKKLLEHVQQLALKYQVKRLFLEVSARNSIARKMYETHGFEPVGERKDYYTKGDNALLYTLNLE